MKCELCPRMCGVDRAVKTGFCGMGEEITAAKSMLHFWEEPCVSGTRGSGAVFFSGCVMKCAFCQNYAISAEKSGRVITEERLAEIFLELQEKGAANINLVNPTHFVPQILRALETAKRRGLTLPIVYNTGGYERVETLRTLEGAVDVYLPDVKYFDDELAKRLSSAPNYFETAMSAVAEMIRQVGKPQFNERGEITRGVIVRHLVLPEHYKDSIEVINRLGERFGRRHGSRECRSQVADTMSATQSDGRHGSRECRSQDADTMSATQSDGWHGSRECRNQVADTMSATQSDGRHGSRECRNQVADTMSATQSDGDILFSLMSQYTPFGRVKTDPALKKMNRRITTFEYRKALDAATDAGLDGFMQEKSSAAEEYTPSFDLEGL